MRDVSSSIVGGISTPMWNDFPLLSLGGSTSHVTMFKRYCCVLDVLQGVTFGCYIYL